MSDLIEREDAIRAVNAYDDTAYALQDVQRITDGIVKVIKSLPSARPKGEWIPYEASLNFGDGEGYVIEHKCSACGYLWGEPDYKFCPNCGADMRGPKESE